MLAQSAGWYLSFIQYHRYPLGLPLFPVERAVYQRLFVLLSLFASLPAMAISFQTRLEKAEWTVSGDIFECRLTQPVTDFGSGEFVRRAGELSIFRLSESNQWLGAGSATLLAAAAPWQPGRGDINLGQVSVRPGNQPFNSSQDQAGRLLTGLLNGRSPVVRHRTLRGGEHLEVRLLPVRFNPAYNEFMACSSKLLPVNFDQIRNTQVGFPGGGTGLDEMAEARLDIILEYLKADPSVNRIALDGHSDNSGNRLTNRDLSRKRALAVDEYLIANGVPAEQIVMRFHGERYPLASNSNAANRARNRRVNITLTREPVVAAQEEAPAESLINTPDLIDKAAAE